ncbi:hypothetical protein OROGR_000866 [Orobanche gracilis]
MDLTVANKGDGNNDNNYNNNNENMLRDYRKGNWNLQETMVLIEAKKMDGERRMRRLAEINERGKPAELRWKWVEDYCWKNGCLRSQNQCNDKWDNLMRDFKKIRDYQKKRMAGDDDDGDDRSNYWRINKNERKDNNLPSNMLPQIYEALVEVVERKGQTSSGGAAGCSSVVSLPEMSVVGKTNSRVLGHHQHTFLPSSPVLQQYSNIVQAPAILVAPPPAEQTPADTPCGAVPNSSPPLPTATVVSDSDTHTSEYSGSPAKRKKRRGGGGEGTTQELGSAISTIAEAIESCEEREERRHREVMSVHEMNRQGINGIVDAIHKLADSIFALAAANK